MRGRGCNTQPEHREQRVRDVVRGELDVGRRAQKVLQEVSERVVFAVECKDGGVGAVGIRGGDDSK